MKLEKSDVQPRAPTIGIFLWNKIAYSETFIQHHIQHLPARVKVLEILPHWPRENFEKEALRFLISNQVDAVLAEKGLSGTAVMNACRQLGIPLVVHFHGFDAYSEHEKIAQFRLLYPKLFQSAAAFIAVSRHMRKHLIGIGVPRAKLHYNACGADTHLFRGGKPGQSKPIFLAVGRFVDKKAPHLALLAFSKAAEAFPQARLIMVGDGPLLEATVQLARSLRVAPRVRFLGPQPHGRVAWLMRRCRAFIQHSIRTSYGDSEGTPVAVLEAGATGIPVVATRHGGIADVVVDRVTGFLVEEGDVTGMARAMLRLARDPELAARLGKAARERISRNFTLEKSIGNLWSILDRAIREARSR